MKMSLTSLQVLRKRGQSDLNRPPMRRAAENDSDPSHGDFAVKGVVQLIMDIVLWSWIEGSEPVV
jgi:hypothetical protein